MLENTIAQSSTTDYIITSSPVITAIAALASAVLLYFYTKYTRKMQESVAKQVEVQVRQTKELVHQRRLGIMPYLTIEILNGKLLLTNIGNSLALNVEIKSSKNSELLQSPFEKIPKILPKEKIGVLTNGNIIEQDVLNSLTTHYGGEDRQFINKIYFYDLEGNLYEENLKDFSGKTVRCSFPKLISEDKE